ncbi:MAG: hypothetical protein KME21_02570 [Desmonostoc vinosum HA7617-LM4]|jgi:hypothetical protein|nr:hypothetical protein [Desmonostoc vinosum HA7617-LM4]
MKKLISTIVVIICSVGIVSCSSSQTDILSKTSINTTQSPKNQSTQKTPSFTSGTSQKIATKQPKTGTVKEMVNGDIMCYVTLVDETGREHNVGASFEICEKQDAFLNKKVRAFYEIASVNDCQSAEPCGKTRKESLITKLEILH